MSLSNDASEPKDDPATHEIFVSSVDDDGVQPAKVEAVPYSASQFPMRKPSRSQNPRRRPRSPGLKWYKPYDGPDCFKIGRVLVIDYIKQEQSKQGMRKVAAQEFDSEHGLRHLYSTPARVGEPLLRVIHCQNASWATHFLLRKFNINAQDDLVGTDFGKWVKYKRPESRGGKPYLNGKTWKTTHDPWRGISRSSFGLDYLKYYKCPKYQDRSSEALKEKMFELNHYDEEDNPKYGFDLYVQRISCYIQHKDPIVDTIDYPGIESPYDESNGGPDPQHYVPHLESLDNGNVIIIFENSPFNSPWDTLISAREQWESRWRRLPFYLSVESHDLSSDDNLSLECMRIILADIWKSVSENWEAVFDICNTHVSILEDKIYDGPADESRAPELWSNSSMWLKVERLVGIHGALSREMQTNLRELTGDPQDIWLEQSTDDMNKLTVLVQDDLVKPTANLADLMYKSVEIRDSRHSLQLNTSMW
ncbi:uncharacterized protein KY384_006006 [Bacidia gigantensis]|uniref:uncharacterized protein n=1 Tax=Bacidia gigantensis TaxID=2732470 RepID=UPI001D03A1EC|nr:uncharacterized protein KY384_006006 [Bacidia gigantensis]KAG8529370.1 hypothetical protein KY384_006006 [Bacidia gigantensis]